jgi:hypothetical protein
LDIVTGKTGAVGDEALVDEAFVVEEDLLDAAAKVVESGELGGQEEKQKNSN